MGDKERISFLRKELAEHNHSYYVLDTPTISDFEFDKLLAELKILEDNNPDLFDANSPSKKVGGMVIDSLNAVNHKYPMLSLANTYNAEELQDFDNKIKNEEIKGNTTKIFHLKDASKAHFELQSRTTTGSIILKT